MVGRGTRYMWLSDTNICELHAIQSNIHENMIVAISIYEKLFML